MPASYHYKIGIDVGGTNTDAAILKIPAQSSAMIEIVATYKSPTTPSITSGITSAITALLSTADIDRSRIRTIAVGTTAFVNALVERDADKLQRVAVLRLCGPYLKDNPPLSLWPEELRVCCDGGFKRVQGGLEIHGGVISEVDEDEIREEVLRIRERGVQCVAVVGVFSPLDNEGKQEYRVRDIFREVASEVAVVCSRDVGNIGFIERENATILNTALHDLSRDFVSAISTSISELSLPDSLQLFLTTNSGTLCTASAAMELPIKTFTCGPTNSMAGAAFLTRDQAINKNIQLVVVDIGGTTTDLGFLQPSGFPRQAAQFVEVAGVRTAFSMPDVVSLPLGGGTIITVDEVHKNVRIGPESLGYRIADESLLAGGDTMTVTDVSVASGLVQCPSFGNEENVKTIPKWVIEKVRDHIRAVLTTGIDSMKTSQDPTIVLLVGGGAIIVDREMRKELDGVKEVVEVPFAGAANAVGAAVALVEGVVDTVVIVGEGEEDAVEQKLKGQAIQNAIANGAEEPKTRIVAVEKTQLQYVEEKVIRFIVRAVGPLDATATASIPRQNPQPPSPLPRTPFAPRIGCNVPSPAPFTSKSLHHNPLQYTPNIRRNTWYPSALDLYFISTGCSILGCGGGGSTYVSLLRTLCLLSSIPAETLRIIAPSSLPPSKYFLFGSYYGAPSVSVERIQNSSEVIQAQRAVLAASGVKETDVHGLITDEIGGGNGLVSLISACVNGLPVVDCDAMGRAYPSIEQATPYLFGCAVQPVGVAVGDGDPMVVDGVPSNDALEKRLRDLSIAAGMEMSVSPRPLTGKEVKNTMVLHSLSHAWYLGRAVAAARYRGGSIIDALLEATSARLVYTGKVLRVTTDVGSGYTSGVAVLGPLSLAAATPPPLVEPDSHLRIPFKNEFLYAARVREEGEEMVVAMPDLISLLDMADGSPVASSDLRYGLRCYVVVLPADEKWRTRRGMEVGGLRAFGIEGRAEWEFAGGGERRRSVLDEFGGE